MGLFTFESSVALSTTSRIAAIFVLFVVSYSIGLVIYRLFFSPIAGFPGPKLAAVSGWYEFYYDYFLNGKYLFRIEEMHRKYGPIVRVNPVELSIKDSDFYNTIYVTESTRRTNAFDQYARGIDIDGSHFMSTTHELHRRRRKPLEPFFSRAGVDRLEPMLNQVALKLVSRLDALKGQSTVVNLNHVFSAFTGDVIAKICWEAEENMLDDPDFFPHWFDLIHTVAKSTPLFTAFPLLIQIVSFFPESFLVWADPRSQKFMDFRKLSISHISEAKREQEDAVANGKPIDVRNSLFRYILNSDLPASEQSTGRLSREAQSILAAGTATTARTFGFISYYILSNDSIRKRLSDELKDVTAGYPDRFPRWAELENLPYLSALIKEGLRLGYGVMHRLPRCSPDSPIQYKQWTIPIGTPVGMSAYFMHTDPAVYERPFEFLPDRWLGDINPNMNRNLVSFCRGSRNCIGMTLAYAELYLLLAALYRPGGPNLQLFETDESDATLAHDFLLPLPKLDTKGIRVQVK